MEAETEALEMNGGPQESWEKLQKYEVSKDREEMRGKGETKRAGETRERTGEPCTCLTGNC